MEIITAVSSFLWGYPIIIMLLFTSIYLTIRLKFFQFVYPVYIFKQTIGRVGKKPFGKGTITPFQTLTTALSSTIGAANIVGVPVAIMLGGPGAVFWMWVIAVFGMALKFGETALGLHYREKNEVGEYVGGPTYYMRNGIKWPLVGKVLAAWYAIFLLIELVPSIMVQSNSVASTIDDTFSFSPLITGIIMAVAVGIVVFGGIKRIGKVTSILVPIMAGFYIFAGLIIIFMNISSVPAVFSLIFTEAFNPTAALGGGAGAVLAETIRWGFARGVYSNEAGLGTSPIAHAAAKTDHPIRQALWSVIAIIVDTLIICTVTALVVIMTGVWQHNDAHEESVRESLTARAFAESFGPIGSTVVSVALVIFVFSTITVVVFYGARQAEYLFGLWAGTVMKALYVISIVIGAIGGATILWAFLDLTLFFVIMPNIIAVIILSPKIIELKEEYFNSKKYYQKDVGN
ncbi:sodium:alanine symporter family protein [Salinicoccus sp. ID82-1]|uniref:alanine/glycine:cation symporter family protein n=1 Tax=Salinicoccus sp. ID82-1 TaxID=2820269 RepID=UPI001F31E2CA|nr:sodium:alanine symporter family protein [Salinicoccus sp. ID82-1]MCG1010306.1 sodium:alanine symporter family protein [Salinicoccus sp. ID82-1]